MNVFFTVIIITYNRAEILRQAISSVISQTFDIFELLIVDDGSTDNTREVVDSYDDDRIQYILNDGAKGPGGARNTGMRNASGEWIAFLDDDDVWLPQKLSILYEKVMEADQSTGLIYTGYAYYDFDKKQEISRYTPDKQGWIQNDLLCQNYIGTMSVVAIRNDVVEEIGMMDENMHMFEDGDFYVRIAGSFKIDFIKDVLTYYRACGSDKLSLNYENALKSYKIFFNKHLQLINRSYRLRYRAASRILFAALQLGDIREIAKVLPWTLAGLLIDPSHFTLTCKNILLINYNKMFKS